MFPRYWPLGEGNPTHEFSSEKESVMYSFDVSMFFFVLKTRTVRFMVIWDTIMLPRRHYDDLQNIPLKKMCTVNTVRYIKLIHVIPYNMWCHSNASDIPKFYNCFQIIISYNYFSNCHINQSYDLSENCWFLLTVIKIEISIQCQVIYLTNL